MRRKKWTKVRARKLALWRRTTGFDRAMRKVLKIYAPVMAAQFLSYRSPLEDFFKQYEP